MVATASTLTPVRAGHGFDTDALAGWLGARRPDFAGPLAVRQFEGGQSNPTFLVEGEGGRLVLRKKPPGVLLPSAHAIEREYAILAALSTTDVPIPRPVALCEDASIIGTAFYLMEFVDGDVHARPEMPGAEPARRRAAWEAAIDALARLHAVDPQAVGLAGLGRTDDWFTRQIDRWGRQYRAATGATGDPAMARLEAWLMDRRPATSAVSLVHGDFRLGNLLFARGEGRVLAILDWELASLGDPLTDLAYCCLTHRLPVEDRGVTGLLGLDREALGIPSEEELVARYAAKTGRPIGHWTFALVLSLYRLAAILAGVGARALAGNAASTEAAIFGEQAGLLIETAVGLTEGA